MAFHLKKILKAMLASTSDPLSVKDIQAVVTRWHEQREKDADAETDAPLLGGNGAEERAPAQALIRDIISQVPTLLTATQIREAISDLNREMEETGDVTRILQGPEGFRMTIAPEFAEWIRLLRNDPRPQKLSQAALETLAIVAYRQPVTRGEIEAVRGVSSDSAIARLSDLELIAVSGRADLPGRPSQFSTTPKFLDFVGLRTLSELPESDVLSPAQIAAWIERAKNPSKATAADVGLPDGAPAEQAEIPLPPETPPEENARGNDAAENPEDAPAAGADAEPGVPAA